jgi:hypothetical protein
MLSNETPTTYISANLENIRNTLLSNALCGYSIVFKDVIRLTKYFPSDVTESQRDTITNRMEELGDELREALSEIFMETSILIESIVKTSLDKN